MPSLQLCFIKSHRFRYLYAYAERHGNRHTHPYVFFLFIFIPVTHQYAVSFCPAPSSDCLFALSLSSRLTPTLDQQHPVSLFIKCLFLQSAGFAFTEMSPLLFPAHAKVYSYATYYPHTVPSLVFRLCKRSVLSTYVIILPNRTDWYLTSILTGSHYTLRPHDPTPILSCNHDCCCMGKVVILLLLFLSLMSKQVFSMPVEDAGCSITH